MLGASTRLRVGVGKVGACSANAIINIIKLWMLPMAMAMTVAVAMDMVIASLCSIA